MYVEYVIAKLFGIKLLDELKLSSELRKLIEQRGDQMPVHKRMSSEMQKKIKTRYPGFFI
ncbi:hypothetical protein SAMN05216311_10532 [Chitinophaga sp. CF418]|nr:hypothetical protein SAMN05216311_10532 [Chitinophaga sp. CF418]